LNTEEEINLEEQVMLKETADIEATLQKDQQYI